MVAFVEAVLCSIGRDTGVVPFVEAVPRAALSGPTKGLRRSAAAHESFGGALHNRPSPSMFSEVLISISKHTFQLDYHVDRD